MTLTYSPLAWQIAREAQMFAGVGGVIARVRLYTNEELSAGGQTSTDAMHNLAEKLDHWAARRGEWGVS